MDELSRRQLMIAAGATGVAAGAVGAVPGVAASGHGGGPRLPKTPDSYKFALADAEPKVVRPGGSITVAGPENFPVTKHNHVSIGYLRLKPGALREPHWHPTHWEVDYAIQGKGELGIVTPDDEENITRLRPGDVGFIPTGWAHYIRNVGDTELVWVLIFNNPLTDIGLSTMFAGMPTRTFNKTLGVSLNRATKPDETLLIV